jgi:hypothetical protein
MTRPVAMKSMTDSGKPPSILINPRFTELIGADYPALCAHISSIETRID